MAEDAGEQLAGTDRSQLSAAPKSIAEVKAEIAETRNRIAATIDRTIDRLPSVFRTSQESERAMDRVRIGTIAGTLSACFGAPVTDLPSVNRPDSLSAPDWSPLPASRFC